MGKLANRYRAFSTDDPPFPGRGTASPPGSGKADAADYVRIMQVLISHDYYNGDGGACADLEVCPTGATAGLMKDLGLLLRSGGTAFSVILDRQRKDALLTYLKRDAVAVGDQSGAKPGYWTRLSFTLAARNPAFVNFTDLPVDMCPRTRNQYLSNSLAEPSAAEAPVELAPERWGDGLEVWPLRRPVVVGRGETVTARSISGALELCLPSCVPVSLARTMNPDRIDCDAVSRATGGRGCLTCSDAVLAEDPAPRDCVYRNRVFVNFSNLPEGFYTLAVIEGLPRRPRARARKLLRSAPEPEWIDGTKDVIHTVAVPIPMFFLDLFFSPVRGGTSPCYPVRGLAGGNASVEAVTYSLHFRARSTLWAYYVSARPGGPEPEELAIWNTGTDEPACFVGPFPVRLANGMPASLLVSCEPIRLSQQPTVRFGLRGRLEAEGPVRTLVDPLPAAGARQVLPLDPAELVRQVERAAASGNPDAARRERMDRLLRSLTAEPAPVFSNIFVTV